MSHEPDCEDPPPQAEEHIRLLLENVRDYAIFTTDCENRIATWNAGARQRPRLPGR